MKSSYPTLFYAESGGQESDAGTIDGIPVVGAIKSGSRIVYTLERQPTFRVGDQVITQIDWQRRYALMKLHFAVEVILELFTQNLQTFRRLAHISQQIKAELILNGLKASRHCWRSFNNELRQLSIRTLRLRAHSLTKAKKGAIGKWKASLKCLAVVHILNAPLKSAALP